MSTSLRTVQGLDVPRGAGWIGTGRLSIPGNCYHPAGQRISQNMPGNGTLILPTGSKGQETARPKQKRNQDQRNAKFSPDTGQGILCRRSPVVQLQYPEKCLYLVRHPLGPADTHRHHQPALPPSEHHRHRLPPEDCLHQPSNGFSWSIRCSSAPCSGYSAASEKKRTGRWPSLSGNCRSCRSATP